MTPTPSGLFAAHDVCLIRDGAGASDASHRPVVDALAERGRTVMTLAVPPSQISADLRRMPYVSAEEPPVVQLRELHGSVFLDRALFRGPFAAFHSVWGQLGLTALPELTIEAIKLEARVYVATNWWQLPAIAVAAAYHDAAAVFMPAAGAMADSPLRTAPGEPFAVLLEQLLCRTVDAVLVPPSECDEYAALFTGAVHGHDGAPDAAADILAALVATRTRPDYWRDHPTLAKPSPGPSTPADTPLLSVCIPTFSRAPLLLHAMTSICAQAARYGVEHQLELVVSDNASPDDTADVVELVRRHSGVRVRYSRNDENRGVGYNVVKALDLAEGTFCLLLGDDDFVVEAALPRLLAGVAAADSSTTLVVFRGQDRDFPAEVPTPFSVADTARQFFYHVGNFGRAVVRMAPLREPLQALDWATLQRFWPQTELYFRGMLATGAVHPTLAIPDVVVTSPLHLFLTRYTARYLWDEGFFSLYDVALNLADIAPADFIPIVNESYLEPRFAEIADSVLTRFTTRDSQEDKIAAVEAMLHSVRLSCAREDVMAGVAPSFTAAVMNVILRYAAPDTMDDLRALLSAMAEATTDSGTRADVSA